MDRVGADKMVVDKAVAGKVAAAISQHLHGLYIVPSYLLYIHQVYCAQIERRRY
jgi:hypothetical protein